MRLIYNANHPTPPVLKPKKLTKKQQLDADVWCLYIKLVIKDHKKAMKELQPEIDRLSIKNPLFPKQLEDSWNKELAELLSRKR